MCDADFDASYKFDEGNDSLTAGAVYGQFKALLQSLSIQVNSGTYCSSLVIGKDPPQIDCDFNNNFSPADGVIVVDANDRGKPPTQAPAHWSNIT